jgi:cytochrome c oxidase cbb3-type subunit 1
MSALNPRITRPDAVDLSCRLPVLKLGLSSVVWLVVGLLLALGASVALHTPGFAPCEYVGYGKLAAASRTALVYGFASQAGLAVGIWLLARFSGSPLRTGLAITVGAVIWNLGVLVGVVGIFCGEQTGLPYFDFPGYAGSILLAGYGLMAVATLASIGPDTARPWQLPQWFILAALAWFPWMLATAQVFLVWFPVRGVLQAVIGSWYAQGLFWGWLAPLTLGTLLHLVPELTNQRLARKSLAHLGFWTLLLLAGWHGASSLVGGPVPAWVASTGVVAGVLLVIPVTLIALNLFNPRPPESGFGPTVLHWTRFSAIAFVLAGVATAITSPRCAGRLLHFTLFPQAIAEVWLLGFVTLGLFAGLYQLLPRLIGFTWNQAGLTFAHLGLSLVGLVLAGASYGVAGWVQGQNLAMATVSMASANEGLAKYLMFHSLGVAALLAGQLAFALHVVSVALKHFPAAKRFVISLFTPEPASDTKLAPATPSTK